MFLTLCYAFLTLVVQRQRKRLCHLIKDRLGCGTLLFHKHNTSSSSQFCEGDVNITRVLLENNEKKVTLVCPKQIVNLFEWTSFQDLYHAQGTRDHSSNSVNILLETLYPELNERNLSRNGCLNVEDYCIPMAWRSSDVFGILVKSSVEDLSLLGAAFLNDQLCLNEEMEIHKIMTVDVEGTPTNVVHPSNFPLSPSSSWSSYLLQTDSTLSTPIVEQTPELCEKLLVEGGAENTEEEYLGAEVFPSLEDIETQEYCDRYGGSNESLAENVLSLLQDSLSDSDTSVIDDVDSICSQLSNEGKAASQSSSPRKLVDGIYCNLENSIDDFEEVEEYCAGEAMAEVNFSPIPDMDETVAKGNVTGDDCISYKPPNIFVYTGEDDLSGPCPWFENIKDNLKLCLNPGCYTIYLLSPSQIKKTPWRENTALLVVSCDNLTNEVNKYFSAFVASGGKLLNFCSNLKLFSCDVLENNTNSFKSTTSMKYKEWDSITLIQGKFRYTDVLPTKQVSILGKNTDGEAIVEVIYAEHPSGVAVMCQVHLEVDPVLLCKDTHTFLQLKQNNTVRISILHDILSLHLKMNCNGKIQQQLTPCYVFTKEKLVTDQFLSSLQPKLIGKQLRSGNITLHFISSEDESPVTNDILPVICNSSVKVPFDTEDYYSNLKTSTLGKVLLYVDVIPTTMPVLTGLTEFEGCIAIARCQTKGRGRGKNEWLSVDGSACFTIHTSIPLKSNLGQKLSFVQHLTSIALVEAVIEKQGYENIDINLKWPNDIYYQNKIKLGGSIVNSTVIGDNVHCFIGCGVNVNNSIPTMCINDIIKIYNQQTKNCLPCLTVEEYIGSAVTKLEKIIEKFQKEGYEAVLPLYYQHWLHSGQNVTLEQTGSVVTIVGLDDYGYLQVETSMGSYLSLQADGNSLDMMRNLIILKT